MSAAAGKARGGRSWMLGLACGLGLAAAPGAMVLLALVMGPTALAWIADTLQGRPVARGVAIAGAACAIAPLVDLMGAGGSIAVALDIGPRMRELGFAWAAQGAAWIAAELLPVIIRAVLDAATVARAAGLRRARAQLEEEWGFPPPDADAPSDAG